MGCTGICQNTHINLVYNSSYITLKPQIHAITNDFNDNGITILVRGAIWLEGEEYLNWFLLGSRKNFQSCSYFPTYTLGPGLLEPENNWWIFTHLLTTWLYYRILRYHWCLKLLECHNLQKDLVLRFEHVYRTIRSR